MCYRRFAKIHLKIRDDTEREKAATDIQRTARGVQARNKLLKQTAVATQVQQTVRGHQARRSMAQQHAAAARIQSGYRGEVARARVRTMLAEKRESETRARDTATQSPVPHSTSAKQTIVQQVTPCAVINEYSESHVCPYLKPRIPLSPHLKPHIPGRGGGRSLDQRPGNTNIWGR